MSLAPWRSPLARALHRNRSLAHARFLQLATVQPDGRPANRTIVFRGFWENTDQLKFVTDSRSEKTDQIRSLTWGEACWYFAKTREQFRLLGSLTLVDEKQTDQSLQEARRRVWQELSDAARTQFTWPQPGKPRIDGEEFNAIPPDSTSPLPQFCLLFLNPEQVDHLELRGSPQNRWLYLHQGESWTVQAINP